MAPIVHLLLILFVSLQCPSDIWAFSCCVVVEKFCLLFSLFEGKLCRHIPVILECGNQ